MKNRRKSHHFEMALSGMWNSLGVHATKMLVSLGFLVGSVAFMVAVTYVMFRPLDGSLVCLYPCENRAA